MKDLYDNNRKTRLNTLRMREFTLTQNKQITSFGFSNFKDSLYERVI